MLVNGKQSHLPAVHIHDSIWFITFSNELHSILVVHLVENNTKERIEVTNSGMVAPYRCSSPRYEGIIQ